MVKQMKVEVIRIVRYVGEEEAVRAALAMSLSEGVKDCRGYEIQVATHSSTLKPIVTLTNAEVKACFVKEQTERKLLGVTPHLTDLTIAYKGPAT